MTNKILDFETYVIFDIETTGLPIYNFNKSNIIELCAMAISKTELFRSQTPRVIHKLLLLFNPRRVIHPNSSKYSGLYNDQLEYEKIFDENAANTIAGFFQHLRGPICLVAHYGDKHDFPILKKAFEKINSNLPENVYCIDSYKAIVHIDAIRQGADIPKEIRENKYENTEKNQLESQNIDYKELLNEDEDLFIHFIDVYLDEIEKTETKNKNDIQKINETTPKRRFATDINQTNRFVARKAIKINSETGEKVKKNLFHTNQPENNSKGFPKFKYGFYKLMKIYERYYNERPNILHQAEADVITLQKILFYYGNDFVKYCERNATPFSNINPL
ncbi:uncharacterized protein LOC129609315 [Condylostylus longicornis]|uniref:uncharacterized protein LOC129609315 n=1 Tax=Condylostylus longicornis TaxID=2530218 RepID=UPI00244DA510|nr:uncharacterized protein LOC129609315 [Condylostylus longicornis]